MFFIGLIFKQYANIRIFKQIAKQLYEFLMTCYEWQNGKQRDGVGGGKGWLEWPAWLSVWGKLSCFWAIYEGLML